jgi:hypothetical protein
MITPAQTSASVTVELSGAASRFFLRLGAMRSAAANASSEAAGAGVRNALLAHFRAREQEPRKSTGFPAFGQTYPRRNFWFGVRGNSVAEAVSAPALYGAGVAEININSPALAHRLAESPPPITPKGGRRYLAVPAAPASAAFEGMPRDFPVKMKFGYAPTPEGRWLPALVAEDNWFVRSKSGKQKRAAADAKGARGVRQPVYWLIKQAQTKHDPRALPETAALQEAAEKAAARAVRTLTQEDK